MSVSQLKQFDPDRFDLDELVALSAEAKSLQVEYMDNGIEVPDWLESVITRISSAIDVTQADTLRKRLRSAEARIAALKPASERRAEAEAEAAALRVKLGK